MFSFLKSRAFWTVLGLILASLLILLFGPILAFGTWRPFDSLLGRAFGIGGLFTLYGLWTIVQNARAKQAGQQLAGAVVKQSDGEGRPSADVVQLRERFEEAIAALKQKKHGGHSLYDLPWYVIIGAPGSGKTTALVNSGLHFPLEQRSGKGALRGVGGTRNCDWWFTEEAIFLDTAGRYTTQDSDAGADSAGWAEFLALLKKYRKRRPVNGVMLAISAHDLMVQGQAGREAHVAAARRRLNELNKELRINLPVYVLVTKCDLVAGFAEYFDDVSQDSRTQIWGVTFPFDQTQKGTAAATFPAEFDALMQRLNERVFARLEDERDVRRRARVFGFPQQMAALREGLSEFVTDVFESTRFDQRVLLRGVYFTSGTQEGTPIDRLLGALGRRFSVPAEAVAPGGRGKAYFIERFLKDVMLAESGLAGVNRRVEVQKAAAQLGVYAAMVLVGVVGLLALWHSYSVNRTYLRDFSAYTTSIAGKLQPGSGSAVSALPRLDRARDLVTRARKFPEDVSWLSRGWGLDHSGWVAATASDVYGRELSEALLDTAKTQIEQRLRSLLTTRDSVGLYQYLRTYLMLANPREFDPVQVKTVADQIWAGAYSGDPKGAARLVEHFDRLLEYDLPGFAPDEALVARVRDAIPPESVPDLLYSLAKLEFQKKELPLPVESFFTGPAPVFRRPAGARVVSGMFTKAAFSAMPQIIEQVDKRFEDEIWVWGSARQDPPAPEVRKQGVWQRYEQEYITAWDSMLSGIGLVGLGDREAVIKMVQAVAGSNSALKQLLGVVDLNTFLAASLSAPKSEGFLSAFGSSLAGAFQAWDREVHNWFQTHTDEPGARVTSHFSVIHALMLDVGGGAPIDKLLARVKELGTKLATMGPVVGGDNSPAATAAVSRASQELRGEAGGLTGPAGAIGALLADIGNSAEKASTADLGRVTNVKFQEVVRQCQGAIEGRYPFRKGAAEEVALDDFTRIFGPSGAFDAFIRNELKDYADVTGSSIAWRPLPSGIDPSGLSRNAKQRLEDALRIRELFFPGGNQLRASYRIMFDTMDPRPKVRRFDMLVDGKPFGWGYEPPREVASSWPGTTATVASATFTEFSGATPNIATESGQWSLFRLLDRGKLDQLTDNRYRLRFDKDGDFVEMFLIADSVKNPFGSLQLLQRFTCGG